MDEYPPVVVIGASAIDTKGRAGGRLTRGTSSHGHVHTNVGGVARNVAENLARLGVPTRLLTAVGEDPMGRQILEQGTDSGIDLSRVLVTRSHHTGAYMSLVDSHGRRFYSLDDMEIVQELTPRWLQLQRRAFDDAGMIVIDANLPPGTLRALMSLAQRRRIPVCADPTSVELAPKLEPHLSGLHVVTPNVAEARSLLGLAEDNEQPAVTLAKALVEKGVHLAIVTMAEEGLVYADSSGSGSIPAMRRDVVDLTGAGDALTAAVVFGLLNDLPTDEAVRLGVSAATLTLQCKESVCPDLSLDRLYDQLVI